MCLDYKYKVGADLTVVDYTSMFYKAVHAYAYYDLVY